MPGVERSEPPELWISGGSLALDPGHPGADGANLELLNALERSVTAEFRGLCPPLITTFGARGYFDEKRTREHVDSVIAGGVDGLPVYSLSSTDDRLISSQRSVGNDSSQPGSKPQRVDIRWRFAHAVGQMLNAPGTMESCSAFRCGLPPGSLGRCS